MCVNISYISTM